MQETITVEQLINEILSMGRESQGTDLLLSRFSSRLKDAFGIDYAGATNLYQDKVEMSGLEEFVINTNKAYIDNRLSGYSAFPELIKHYNLGFRSCLLLPVSMDGKPVFIVTFLSRQEDKFDSAVGPKIELLSAILGYQIVAKAEKERSVNLAKYFDAAFNVHVPQLLIDRNGTIVRANKSMSGLFAKTQRDMQGKNIAEFFNVDVNMLAALREGAAAEIKDTTDLNKTYKASSTKVNDRLLHVLLFDVTELKELEEKVRLSEQAAGETYLLLAKDTTILWSSGNARRVLKIDRDELVGKRLIDLAYSDKAFVNEVGATADTLSRPLRISMGNDMFVDVRAILTKNQFGGFSCVLASNNMEKYINSIRNALDGFAEDATDAVLNVDSLGYVKSVNRSAERLLKYREAELSGTSLASLYADEESRQKLNASLSLARNNGVVENVYVNLRIKDSVALLPCEQVIRSVLDIDNNTVGYMVITKELATKIKMEELEDETKTLEKQVENRTAESELKTQFLTNISHDLKTPLTNIKGFGKLLLENAEELSDEHKEYVRIMNNEADRLYQLIQQILDVAKLSSGRITLDLQLVNFNDLSRNAAIETLIEVAKKKGLEFDWSVDYNVPLIRADPNRLIQVLVNLIGNAIKFTEKGSIGVKIIKKAKNVRVEVIDTGVGISKEDKGKLFKKFFQLQRKNLIMQDGSGTGLGLTIAKEIVSLHGGRVGVISEAGSGSTFWFTLPIAEKPKKKPAEKLAQEGKG